MTLEFENLIKARNGDSDALEAFLSQWRKTLRNMSSNLLGSHVFARADTSDVVQEGIIQTWMNLENFRGSSPQELEAWGRLVGAGNAAKIRRQQLAQCRSAYAEQPVHSELIAPENNPADAAEEREMLKLLSEAIVKLDDLQQSVLLMRVFEGATFKVISGQVGYSVSSVREIFARSIQKLRTLLSAQRLGDQV